MLIYLFSLLHLLSFILVDWFEALPKLQMDEEEKYNRKLDSGLYTLQVKDQSAS